MDSPLLPYSSVHHVILIVHLILIMTSIPCSRNCASFGWDRVNFLHSNWYGATFWICVGNSVDNTGMFSFLLSSAYPEPRALLLLPPPHQRAGWGGTRSWEGTQPGQLTPTDPREIPHHTTSCSACKAGGRRRKGGRSEWWRLSSQVPVRRDGALLSWRWLNTCHGKWGINSLLCLCVWLLLSLLNCLYLHSRVFSLLPFQLWWCISFPLSGLIYELGKSH